MICPKCKSIDQLDRFCGHCGHQLKEPCPECGEWEPIGRVVCKMAVEKIERKIIEAGIRASGKIFIYTIMLMCAVIPFLFVLSIHFFQQQDVVARIYFATFLAIIAWDIISRSWERRIKKSEKEKLFREHPEYVEILKKAGKM